MDPPIYAKDNSTCERCHPECTGSCNGEVMMMMMMMMVMVLTMAFNMDGWWWWWWRWWWSLLLWWLPMRRQWWYLEIEHRTTYFHHHHHHHRHHHHHHHRVIVTTTSIIVEITPTFQSASHCSSCLNVRNGQTCLPSCPPGKFPDATNSCLPCHENCGNHGCTGPLNVVGEGGCNSCDLVLFDDPSDRSNITECINPKLTQCAEGFYKVGLHEFPENHTLHMKFVSDFRLTDCSADWLIDWLIDCCRSKTGLQTMPSGVRHLRRLRHQLLRSVSPLPPGGQVRAVVLRWLLPA